MDKTQAIAVLTQVTEPLQLSLKDHQTVQEALRVLGVEPEVTKKKEK